MSRSVNSFCDARKLCWFECYFKHGRRLANSMYYSNRLKCDRGTASSIVYADMAFKMLNAACFPSLYYEIHTTEMRREEEAFLVLGWLLSNGVDGEAGEQERQHLKSILRAPNAH